ncbi:hypothetical protein Tco_0697810 [Tanacetum coccineum]
MHNNIMAAGSKDRPPMLGPGRYSQWRSRFLVQAVAATEEDNDHPPGTSQRDKDMQKYLALLDQSISNGSTNLSNNNLSTSSKLQEQDTKIPLQRMGYNAFNCKGFGQYAKGNAEKQSVVKELLVSQGKVDEHITVIGKDSGGLSRRIQFNEQQLEQVDQTAADCADERVALANLIANLTLDTEEKQTILKPIKGANASLTQELESAYNNLMKTNKALGVATRFVGIVG